jgi:hypothetical protein
MAAEAGAPTDEPQPGPLAEEAGDVEEPVGSELPAGADEYVEGADTADVGSPPGAPPSEREDRHAEAEEAEAG